MIGARRVGLVGSAVVAALAATASAAHLNYSGASGGSGSASCDAGSVLGTVGAIAPWTSQSGDEWSECTGFIGGKWHGSQYENRVASAPYTNDERVHEYTMVGSGTPDNPTLRVSAHFTWEVSGSAQVMLPADPSWWWFPYVGVGNTPPYVQKQVGSASEWTNLEYDAEFPSDEQALGGNWDETGAYSSGSPTYGTPNAGAGTHSGHFRAGLIVAALPNSAKVRVVFPYWWSGQADVDNATVADWKERARIRCFSHASDAEDADEDGIPDEFSVYDPLTGDRTGDFPQ